MPAYPKFKGNCPRNVSRDAKYTVRSAKNGPVVALTYRTTDDERWYATTEEHPELVRMVNQVKLSLGLQPNGSFYINEYKQVIVPAVGTDAYHFAGDYGNPLRFKFLDEESGVETILSGEPVDLKGNPLAPGDTWVGPHPGIPYVLSAGGNDIKFTIQPRPNVEKDIKLSKVIGPEETRAVASMMLALRGFSGGRFYVNEFCAVFTPLQEGYNWRYVYAGQIDLNRWFPPQHASE